MSEQAGLQPRHPVTEADFQAVSAAREAMQGISQDDKGNFHGSGERNHYVARDEVEQLRTVAQLPTYSETLNDPALVRERRIAVSGSEGHAKPKNMNNDREQPQDPVEVLTEGMHSGDLEDLLSKLDEGRIPLDLKLKRDWSDGSDRHAEKQAKFIARAKEAVQDKATRVEQQEKEKAAEQGVKEARRIARQERQEAKKKAWKEHVGSGLGSKAVDSGDTGTTLSEYDPSTSGGRSRKEWEALPTNARQRIVRETKEQAEAALVKEAEAQERLKGIRERAEQRNNAKNKAKIEASAPLEVRQQQLIDAAHEALRSEPHNFPGITGIGRRNHEARRNKLLPEEPVEVVQVEAKESGNPSTSETRGSYVGNPYQYLVDAAAKAAEERLKSAQQSPAEAGESGTVLPSGNVPVIDEAGMPDFVRPGEVKGVRISGQESVDDTSETGLRSRMRRAFGSAGSRLRSLRERHPVDAVRSGARKAGAIYQTALESAGQAMIDRKASREKNPESGNKRKIIIGTAVGAGVLIVATVLVAKHGFESPVHLRGDSLRPHVGSGGGGDGSRHQAVGDALGQRSGRNLHRLTELTPQQRSSLTHDQLNNLQNMTPEQYAGLKTPEFARMVSHLNDIKESLTQQHPNWDQNMINDAASRQLIDDLNNAARIAKEATS